MGAAQLAALLQAGGALPGAVRDTVRAIAEDAVYRRSLRASLFGRIWRWADEMLDRLFAAARDFPHGRTVAIVAVVVVLALIAARIAFAARLGVEELTREPRAVPGRRSTVADADRLAASGAYLDAVHVLYRALLESLAQRHGLRLHHSRTSGDYARELRRRGSPAHGAFRAFARRHDRIVFGVAACDADAWRALRGEAEGVLREAQAA